MTDDSILKKAHRICKVYKHGHDEPYRFDKGCMIQFANALLDSNNELGTIAYMYAKAESNSLIDKQAKEIKRLKAEIRLHIEYDYAS